MQRQMCWGRVAVAIKGPMWDEGEAFHEWSGAVGAVGVGGRETL